MGGGGAYFHVLFKNCPLQLGGNGYKCWGSGAATTDEFLRGTKNLQWGMYAPVTFPLLSAVSLVAIQLASSSNTHPEPVQ